MLTMDYLNRWRAMPNISPVLKLVSMILWLALRDKAESVTFIRRRGHYLKLLYASKDYGECELVPPPRPLFPVIRKILRHLCKMEAKNPDSSFSFAYTERVDEKIFVLLIDCSKSDNVKVEQLESLLLCLYTQEEAERCFNEVNRKLQVDKKRWIAIAVIASIILPWLAGALFW